MTAGWSSFSFPRVGGWERNGPRERASERLGGERWCPEIEKCVAGPGVRVVEPILRRFIYLLLLGEAFSGS